jgi:hypothetical protein
MSKWCETRHFYNLELNWRNIRGHLWEDIQVMRRDCPAKKNSDGFKNPSLFFG